MVESAANTAGVISSWSTAEDLLSSIWQWLENVCDPEVPVLHILDLGVVRSITLQNNTGKYTSVATAPTPLSFQAAPRDVDQTDIILHITPTYTGCPAMGMITANIKLELLSHGLENVQVIEVLSPAWTTDWMSESGKQKLLAYGIAPPQGKARIDRLLFSETAVACPQCGSSKTEQISAFGSTACKSLYRCLDCREPFDYFKCH